MPTSDTRELLLQRPDVPDEDIDDIIARAAELQDAEQADDGRATVAEVEAVAAELDIAPEYVDKAIAAIQRERAAVEVETKQAAETRNRTLMMAGLGLAAVAGIAGLGVVGGASIGAAQLNPKAAAVEQTGAKLEAALDRQLALAPQLVALAGGDAGPVKAASEAAKVATQIPDRLEAATTLNQAMAESIGRITAGGDEQAQQRLLNLQHEVVGTWNRIDTERARYDEAHVSWERASGSATGRLALSLGLARPPEGD